MKKEYLEILDNVRKPGRYIGGEWNAVIKPRDSVEVRVALAFPDLYELGMSYLGGKILYKVLNDVDGVAAERVFAPWPDYEGLLIENELPLTSLETKTPLKEFDILGFSIPYEMNATNILQMLSLSGIPLLREERSGESPLVIAGGPAAVNPEPFADFFDAFLIGEGEEAFPEIVETFMRWRSGGSKREELFKQLSNIEGVYVPSLYSPEYDGGIFLGLRPIDAATPAKIKKRIVQDLDSAPFPTAPVVPYVSAVHDRISLEVMRGCPHKCKFCQATSVYSPVRLRSVDVLMRQLDESLLATGYDEVSLLSLSTGNYPHLEDLLQRMISRCKPEGIGISLPSLRVEDAVKRLPHMISGIKKTGLTLAPEVGSERLRVLVDKRIDIDALINCAARAYESGWRKVKLYFMVGLPGETRQDIDGILDMVFAVSEKRRKTHGRAAEVTMSVSTFIPKPHTPFQREGMAGLDYILDVRRYIRAKTERKRIKVDFHEPRMSIIEGMLSRGDRRMGSVILAAYKSGGRFDGWTDHFSFERWMSAFLESGLDPNDYMAARTHDKPLPWDHISL